ncbi:Histone acetyltransferase HAC12 [Acorus calamus]|uniref:histone acetyltransferase n=1 Tax=Acorus calamus TaxID=4465 RepID=A0AAV9DR29_ACOCL|nr:Histone acetyltransferase HAC12 [Acorus calamus]
MTRGMGEGAPSQATPVMFGAEIFHLASVGGGRDRGQNTKDESHSEVVETPEQLGELKSGYLEFLKDESSPEMVEAMQVKVDDTVTGEDSTPPGVNTSLRCCVPCYNDKRSAVITVDWSSVPKSNLVKMKNDAKKDESVGCNEKCETWQHQICALFNGKRNGLLAQYTCPHCYIQQLENGERTPLPPYEFLGAMDLPRTKLSDHLEQRLHRKLNDDRRQRAEALGKDFSEVPGVEGVVVRVVSSIEKVVEVKKTILDIIEEDYPKQFPYKSKVIMVFQKFDGIEVFLFGMYVQEYGSNCPEPNRRHAYLAYLNSVKYFRPDTDIKSATGEALHTFVYHEILGTWNIAKDAVLSAATSGHVHRAKDRIISFITIQTPKGCLTLKTTEVVWYAIMLQKAAEEHIVVGTTNIYDRYFLSSDECKVKFYAAHLPYFDGDYWPNALEDIIKDVQKEKDEKERIMAVPERALKYAAHQLSIGHASKEYQIMKKFGSHIRQCKENLIVAQLQHACTRCREYILSGKVWVCRQCSKRKFQLCEKCYESEQNLGEWKHPSNCREKHSLSQVEVDTVHSDTEGGDDSLYSTPSRGTRFYELGLAGICDERMQA